MYLDTVLIIRHRTRQQRRQHFSAVLKRSWERLDSMEERREMIAAVQRTLMSLVFSIGLSNKVHRLDLFYTNKKD
jgi:hypothetical protein